MAHRVVDLLNRVGVEKEFVITGGIAKNIGIVKRVEKELGIQALKPDQWRADPRFDPMLAGAVGAALFAKVLYERSKG